MAFIDRYQNNEGQAKILINQILEKIGAKRGPVSCKAVIFDMDGVIIDSEPYYDETHQTLFKELGIPVSRDLFNRFRGTKSFDMWFFLKQEYQLDHAIEELIHEERLRYLQYLKSLPEIIPIPGIRNLINELLRAKYKLALASSAPMECIDTVLALLQMQEEFPIKVCGDDVSYAKPEPEIFIMAAQKIRVDPKNCLVFEDSKHGVNAAKRAGMLCVGFAGESGNDQDLSEADIIINDFRFVDNS